MKYDLHNFRNIGIMAHIDAGKTTTSERILYYSGKNYKIGEVHEGCATMDWMVQEQERGITITSAATTVYWKDCRINLIDTPGHVDFTIEVERSLRVLDGAIAVFDAANGVEPQSETVWRQAEHYHVPRLAFLNKMDKVGADVEMCLDSMRTKLNTKPILMQLPIGTENNFRGIVDLVEMEAHLWPTDDKDVAIKTGDIPADLKDDAELYNHDLILTLADYDDNIAELVMEEKPVPKELIYPALRKAVCELKLVPVFVGSAFKNKGVQLLLDAVVNYLPSPLDVPPVQGIEVDKIAKAEIRKPTEDEPFSGIVFKIMSDPFVNSLSYLRVYSGKIKAGEAVLNVIKNKKERPLKMFRMHANDREEISEAFAGEIVALVGMKFATTGDTLSDISHPICYEAMDFPDPVISLAVEPKSSADFDKLQQSLLRFTQEDPSLKVMLHDETGQVLLAGMGELHLQIIVDRLQREFKLDVNVGKPQVAYRECILLSSTKTEHFTRALNNKVYTADVKLIVEPNNTGKGDKNGNIIEIPTAPNTHKLIIASIKEALDSAITSGVLCGFPLVNVRVKVLEYSFDPQNIDDVVYKISASNAFRAALQSASPQLMEPIMKVEVVVPGDYSGTIVSDINGRRGRVVGMEQRHHLQVVHAEIPLGELFGYETAIRSMSQGRASSTMQFNSYEPLPANLQQNILGN